MRSRRFLFFICLLSLLISVPLFAQLPTAGVNGVVSDPTGAVVPGARVTLTNVDNGVARTVSSGASGEYTIPGVMPGNYKMSVVGKGFGKTDMVGLHLETGKDLTVNVKLTISSQSEVSVSDSVSGIELTQSEVQGQITEQTMSAIPLNGRNFIELAYLAPGNRPATNFDPTKTNTLEVSSAGQFGRGGNTTVDGGDNNDEVVGGLLANFPQDAVHEFQIATNHYTAEVGRSASSIINISTKSGTNEVHGDLFGDIRNRNLDAMPALLPPGSVNPPFDRQQFGGSFGGPIIKDKAWWFISGEDRNQHASVPTAFRDFATNQVVPGAASAPLDDLLLFGRFDYKFGDHDIAYARWDYNRSAQVSEGSAASGEPAQSAANRQRGLNRFNSWLGEWDHTLNNNQINTLSFHADTFVNDLPFFGDNLPTTNPDLALTNELRFPSLEDGANYRIPQRTRFNRYQWKDNFAWTLGKHTVHFGGEVQKQIPYAMFDLYGSGSIILTQNFGTQLLVPGQTGAPNDLDIPIAAALRAIQPNIPVAPSFSNTYLGTYVQDDWKLLPNLTVNAGLRWEYDTDVTGSGGANTPCASIDTPQTTPCVWADNANVLNFKTSPDYKDFSPRLGFAWDPFKSGKTVVRGGYGMYYDRIVLETRLLPLLLDGRNIELTETGGSFCTAPSVSGSSLSNCSLPGAQFAPGSPTLANPFIGSPTPVPLGINVLDPNLRHPVVQQFTLGIQQQLGANWLVSADGLHNFGTHFIIGQTLKDPKGNAVSITDPLTGITNEVTDIQSTAKNWYDGLLVSLQKKPTRIFGNWSYGFNMNYTLSKTLNYSNDDQIPFTNSGQIQDLYNIQNINLEKSYAPTDERHRLTLYGQIQAPYKITIAPIVTLSSSVPMDTYIPALSSRLPILARNALGREITTGAELNTVIDQWNAMPVCTSPNEYPCRIGNPLPLVDPNLRFGDMFASADLRVTKTFTIRERQSLQLIAECFNVSNTVNIRGTSNTNYSGRVSDITAPNFNQALSTAGGFFGAGGPRAFQFAVRYEF
jgi:hypothetical protein